MRGRPPRKTMTDEQERAASAFVGGAEAADSGSGRAEASGEALPALKRAPRSPEAHERPWEAAHVREDVMKGFALRLPEPLFLQAKWVAAAQGVSMNELCREAVAAVVAEHLGR